MQKHEDNLKMKLLDLVENSFILTKQNMFLVFWRDNYSANKWPIS